VTVESCGIDVVEIARVRRVLERRGEAFEALVLSPGERGRLPRRPGPRARAVAMRWAAKEAILKAAGIGLWGGVELTELEIAIDGEGRATALLSDAARGRMGIGGGPGGRELRMSVAAGRQVACAGALVIRREEERET